MEIEAPIEKFNQWWQQALKDSPLKQKSAVCVSTIDAQGFPQARFVDLKSASNDGFTFCTYLDSNKGADISNNNKVAITAWWEHVGYQVRIVGFAEQIDKAKAEQYWQTRNKEAQLTTSAFEQSQPLSEISQLETKFNQIKQDFAEKEVPMPSNWGGYIVKPVSIEFLTFAETRLHLRELFEKRDTQWQSSLLQP